MKIQNKEKIESAFSVFKSKYLSSKEYFICVKTEFFSGVKKYEGVINFDENENKFTYSFLLKQFFNDFSNALSALCDDILKYDSAAVTYYERGQVTIANIDSRGVKIIKKEIAENDEIIDTTQLREKDYIINPQKAQNLMRVLGYLTDDGKIKNDMIRKYNQTERFIELIAPMFDDVSGKIHVVDCGCGKSYLSFVLNYYLWEVRRIKAKFTGIDISEDVITESKNMANKLNYKNMEFICGDLQTVSDTLAPDVVISLHACDIATDMALGFAIKSGAKKIVCVPCCHKELLDKYKKDDLLSITKHGVLKTRLNDILTDGIRMAKLEAEGYEVGCVEYCSPLDTPKNLLIKAEKKSKKNLKAEEAYLNLIKTLSVYPSIEIFSTNRDE